jgi:uncharacterized protein (TIGR02147 family)
MELETQIQTETENLTPATPRSSASASRSAALAPHFKNTPPTPVISARAPVIFSYQDYRQFLKNWFAWKKEVQPRYSGALFAKKAGLGSAALLGMVIRGERNLSYETIRAFTLPLHLKGREKAYFEKLVLFNQSKKSEDRTDFFEQLVSLSQGSGSGTLTKLKDYARYLSRWYIVVIRELVLLPEFQPNPEWITEKLKKKITKREAESAWKILLDLGMVKQNPSTGRFEQIESSLEIDPGSGFFKSHSRCDRWGEFR